MAVNSKEDNSKLILEIDNGELKKLKEVMEKWQFKDYASLMQFAISIMVLNENRYVSIKKDGETQNVAPANDLLRK
ncbi:MAG TPA: hypothetical protein VGW78_07630 [Candidatus Babeliales bacterium]|jgi:hypothetical protein|nr:hypothetical protein [Candidatus Babeliales bacterium]